MNRPEQILQRSCVQAVALHPASIRPTFLAINPAPTKVSAAVGRRCKDLGARAGTPDAFVAYRGKHCWVEFKADKGSLSPVQKALIQELRDHGEVVLVVKSLPEFLGVLDALGVPSVARVAA